MPRLPSRPRPPERANPARIAAERAGRRAEMLAGLYFQLSGYRVLYRRYRTPLGEIDLVLTRFGTLVFVEVKARTCLAEERAALEAVDRRRLVRAAQYFVSHHPRLAERPMRFDVIFLARRAWPRHVRNAFDASGRIR